MPALTTLYKVLDLHIHTNLSTCAFAQMTLPLILRRMEELAYRTIGITDHAYDLHAVRALEVKRRSAEALGCELDTRFGLEVCLEAPGRPHLPLEAAGEADFVTVSATHFGLPWVEPLDTSSPAATADHVLRMFESAAEMEGVDVVVHPFLADSITGESRPFPDVASLMEMMDAGRLDGAIERMARNSIAVELTAKAVAPTVFGPLVDFYIRCRDAGVKFSFGSDAHRPEVLGMTRGFQPMIEILELTDEHVWQPRD